VVGAAETPVKNPTANAGSLTLGEKPDMRRLRLLLRIGLVALMAGYPLLVLTSGSLSMYADASIFAVVIAAAAAACWLAYRRGTGSERRFWLLLVAINLLTMVSQVWSAAYLFSPSHGVPSMPSFADFLNMAAAGCFLVLAGSMVIKSRWTPSSAFRHVLDATSLAVVTYAILALGYVTPLYAAVGIVDTSTIAVSSGYPLVGVAIGTLCLMTYGNHRGRLWAPWERAVTASLSVYAVALLFWPTFMITADYVALNASAILFSLAFLAGHYIMFGAALIRLSYPGEWSIRRGAPGSRSHHAYLAVFAPLVALAATLALAYMAWWGSGTPSTDAIALACAVMLVVLLAARSSAVVFENAQLQQLAVTDGLTGLLDQRQFLSMAADQVQIAQRYGDPIGLVVLDLDSLSSLNSRHGNQAGDAYLRSVAHTLVRYARPGDTAFRSGDDEFALLMPDSTAAEATQVAEAIRLAIAACETGSLRCLTASVGVAVFPEDALDHHQLLRRAEAAAYYSKTHGKNQVTRYDASREFDPGPKARAERLQSESRLSTVRALAAAVDARDAATQFHSRNVARLCVVLGRELGLSRTHIEQVETAALLHDIGKIGVSDVILRKPGRLTPSERAEVQQHAVLSERILAGTNLREILPWILSHHERWDGAGYPSGLVGAQIPFEARMLAVCDAYDAMTSDRPYRSALSPAAALQEMDLNMGTQFDPVIAEAFIRVVGRTQAGPTVFAAESRPSAS